METRAAVQYNNYDKELLKSRYPKDKNKKVIYKVVGTRYNWDKNMLERGRTITLPQKQTVVIDDDWVDIAYIKQYKDGEPEFGDITITVEAMCLLVLDLRKADDRKKFEYIELSDFNQSNPNRDPGATALIERHEPGKEAAKNRTQQKKGIEAVKIAAGLSAIDIEKFFKKQGWTKMPSEEQMREKVENYAFNHPSKFLASDLEDPEDEVLNVIEIAQKKNLLVKNTEECAWETQEGEHLVAYPKIVAGKGKKHTDSLVDFVKSPEGQVWYKDLKDSLFLGV